MGNRKYIVQIKNIISNIAVKQTNWLGHVDMNNRETHRKTKEKWQQTKLNPKLRQETPVS